MRAEGLFTRFLRFEAQFALVSGGFSASGFKVQGSGFRPQGIELSLRVADFKVAGVGSKPQDPTVRPLSSSFSGLYLKSYPVI